MTVLGLGAVMGSTGHVFPLVLNLVSSKSDGYGRTLKGLLVLQICLKTKKPRSTHNLPYTFAIYQFIDVQCAPPHLDPYGGGFNK
jgi:hypothetical protein